MGEASGTLRTFRIRGLDKEDGCVLLQWEGKTLYAVDVRQGEARLTTAVDGPARVTCAFDTRQTLEGVLDGSMHPIVAALQSRLATSGDRRFALRAMLALRASAPAFVRGRP